MHLFMLRVGMSIVYSHRFTIFCSVLPQLWHQEALPVSTAAVRAANSFARPAFETESAVTVTRRDVALSGKV
jgi:hypothetical protein